MSDFNEYNYLCHYGIKGMKWGVRRYQNYDGSLTELGKKKQRQLRSLSSVENSLTNKEYDMFYDRKGAHKDRGTRKVLNEWLNYRNEHEDAIVSVAKNNSVVFASHDDNGWEIGWATSPNARGKGITDANIQEAVKEIRVKRNNADDIYADIDVSNIASVKAAERNGFINTGIKKNIDNRPHERFVYDGNENAKPLANNIYEEAKRKEPQITKDVKSSSNKLYGLNNRLKTRSSIERKINKEHDEENVSHKEAASNIKDSVRYTQLSNDKTFVKDYNNFKERMANKGYEEVRCKNNWDAYNKGEVKHKSVQSTFQDKDGFLFEVQFQTPSSQNAKDKKLPLYEERRKVGITPEQASYLEKRMDDLAKTVSTPPGIDTIKTYDKLKR